MDKTKRLLEDILGVDGFQSISKALQSHGPEAITARAVLAWMVAQVSPLQIGETKEVRCPGSDDVMIKYERTSPDAYTATYSRDGVEIQSYPDQILPTEDIKKSKDEEPKHGFDSVKAILATSASPISAPSLSDHSVWSVIGKLVDALIAKQHMREDFTDAMDKREMKGDDHKVAPSECPKEIQAELDKKKENDKALVQDSQVQDVSFKVNKEELGKAPIKVREKLEKPYASDAQRRWAHTSSGVRALGAQGVKHWDKASKGLKLPEKVDKEERKLPCPHGRPPGRPCPHCLGLDKAELEKAKIIDFKTRKLLADLPSKGAPSQPPADPKLSGLDPNQQEAAAKILAPKQQGSPDFHQGLADIMSGRTIERPKAKLKRKTAKPLSPAAKVARSVRPPAPVSHIDEQKGGAPASSDKYVGTHRVHLSHGIGKVIGVQEHDFNGQKRKVHVMEINDGGAPKKVFIPSESMETRTRPITDKNTAEKIRQYINSPSSQPVIDHQTWNRRYREYMEKIHTGKIQDVADVYKDLVSLQNTKSLSFGERKLLDQAANLLDTELTNATGQGLGKSELEKATLPGGVAMPERQKMPGATSSQHNRQTRYTAARKVPPVGGAAKAPSPSGMSTGMSMGSMSGMGMGKEEKKAEMPSGAAMPKQPKPPQPPKPPVSASNQPAAAASKQAQQSARGKQQMPPKPNMKAPGPQIPQQTQKKPAMKDEVSAHGETKPQHSYFKSKLNKIKATVKSEKTFKVDEQELYTPCHHCGIPEFFKSEDGKPKFRPCMCFRSETVKDDNRTPKNFVQIEKSEDGQFHLTFDKSADQESVKAFLLLLKTALLARKL